MDTQDYIHIKTAGGEIIAKDFTDIATLHRKLAQVAAKIGAVAKKQRSSQGYMYVGYEDLAAQVRPLLAEAGLAFSVSAVSHECGERYTSRSGAIMHVHEMRIGITFTDTETGAMRIICGHSVAHDSSDKGSGQALTYAVKYILMRNWLVSEKGEIDPDFEHPERETHAKPEPKTKPRSSKKYQAPTPPQGPAPKDDPQAHEDAFGPEPRITAEQAGRIEDLRIEADISVMTFIKTLSRDFGKVDTDSLTEEEADQVINRLVIAGKKGKE